MIPRIYGVDEEQFSTNGYGVLTDTESCIVIDRLAGVPEAELIYPAHGLHAEHICDGAIIYTDIAPGGTPQPLRIYRILATSPGRLQIYARHIANDLAGITVTPFTAVGAKSAMSAIKSHEVVDSGFSFSSALSTTDTVEVKTPTDVWSLLGGGKGCIQAVHGGEYIFDKRSVSLVSRRGADRGATIRYAKNLTSLQQDRNCAKCYTAVHPYWKNDEKIIQLPELTVAAEGTYGYTRILPLDCSKAFENEPGEDELRQYTKQYIADNGIGVPEVSWKVDYVQLSKTDEYRGIAAVEEIAVGDSVSVVFEQLRVSGSARVVELRYDPLNERITSITLGEPAQDVASIIAGQNKAIGTKVDGEYVRNEIDRLSYDQIFDKLTDYGRIQGIYEQDSIWYINAQIAKIVNLVAETISAGKLKSVGGDTCFDLDLGKITSIGENGGVVIGSGAMMLQDSKDNVRVLISNSGTVSSVYLLKSDGTFAGGMTVDGDTFYFAAPDNDNGAQVTGYRVAWKNVNGSKMLVTY